MESSFAWSISRDPIFLVFSVGNLTRGDCCASLTSEQSLTDRCTNEVALELRKFARNLIKLSRSLRANSFIILANLLLFLLTHALFDFFGLREASSADLQCHVPVGKPLFTR